MILAITTQPTGRFVSSDRSDVTAWAPGGHGMGNCCSAPQAEGGALRPATREDRARRERTWQASGIISIRDQGYKVHSWLLDDWHHGLKGRFLPAPTPPRRRVRAVRAFSQGPAKRHGALERFLDRGLTNTPPLSFGFWSARGGPHTHARPFPAIALRSFPRRSSPRSKAPGCWMRGATSCSTCRPRCARR